jgi:hypothetical protein
MSYARDFHSMCYLDEYTLYVTGSRKSGAEKTVEKYSVMSNTWTTEREMIDGRSRHSSCGFAQKALYVFCGWINKDRSTKIERLDV